MLKLLYRLNFWESSQEETFFDNFSQAEIIWLAETLYFRYGRELDEGIDLDNVRAIDSLDKIPLTWIVAWEIDGQRGFWGQTIVIDNFQMYLEWHSQWDGEFAREMVNNNRKCRVANMEITEEIDASHWRNEMNFSKMRRME